MTDITEIIARTICASDGYDPNFPADGEPAWKAYRGNAEAVLATFDIAGLALVPKVAAMEWQGCAHAPTYERCNECSRFYADLYRAMAAASPAMIAAGTLSDQNQQTTETDPC